MHLCKHSDNNSSNPLQLYAIMLKFKLCVKISKQQLPPQAILLLRYVLLFPILIFLDLPPPAIGAASTQFRQKILLISLYFYLNHFRFGEPV